MDNNQKLDFIVRYERKQKIKRFAILAIVILFAGAVLVYFQVLNFQGMS